MLKKTPVNYIPVGGLGNTIKGVLTGCTKILEKLSDDYSMKAKMDEGGAIIECPSGASLGILLNRNNGDQVVMVVLVLN